MPGSQRRPTSSRSNLIPAPVAALLACWLAIATPGAATASVIEFNHGFPPDFADAGAGFLEYDRSASFGDYQAWWNLWAHCERSGDFGPCSGLPGEITFSLRVKTAAMAFGDAPDLAPASVHGWTMHAVRPRCVAWSCVGSTDTSVLIGDPGRDWFLNWNCSGEARGNSAFSFIRSRQACSRASSGSASDGDRSWDTGRDGYGYAWNRVYAPEPGTLALVALGLVGLGVSRRPERLGSALR